jgi:hypothetical protein
MDGDDRIISPVRYLHSSVPDELIAYKYESHDPTYTVPLSLIAGDESCTSAPVWYFQCNVPKLLIAYR